MWFVNANFPKKKFKMQRFNCNDNKSMSLIIYMFAQAIMLTLVVAAGVPKLAFYTLPQVEPISGNLNLVVRPLNSDPGESNKNASTGNDMFKGSPFSYREDAKLFSFDQKAEHHGGEEESRVKRDDIGDATDQENRHAKAMVS